LLIVASTRRASIDSNDVAPLPCKPRPSSPSFTLGALRVEHGPAVGRGELATPGSGARDPLAVIGVSAIVAGDECLARPPSAIDSAIARLDLRRRVSGQRGL
jgi:hypothetical protein